MWLAIVHVDHAGTHSQRAESLNGCGLIVFNAPYSVPERMEALLPFLKESLALHETAAEWLVP